MRKHSLTVWPQWLVELPVPVFYRDDGTLLLWRRQDAKEVFLIERVLAGRPPDTNLKHIFGDTVGADSAEP